jgi:hypothetical protein
MIQHILRTSTSKNQVFLPGIHKNDLLIKYTLLSLTYNVKDIYIKFKDNICLT